MSQKQYPLSDINPSFAERGLILHLDATKPSAIIPGNFNSTAANWKDVNLGDANLPTVSWKDLSGNNIDATLNHFGAPKIAWQNDSLEFSGVRTDFVEVTSDGSSKFANQEFTIEVWAKPVLGGNKPLFAYDASASLSCATLRLANNSCVFTFNIDGVLKVLSGVLPDDFDAGKLNQFTCTFKSGEQKIYINSKLLKDAVGKAVIGTFTGAIKYSDTAVYIGKSDIVGQGARFIGTISNVLYYNRVLSENERRRNYIAGTGNIILPANYINVKDYGALGDGVANDTEAIQRALDAAANYVIGSGVGNDETAVPKIAAGGGNVYIPPGIYMVDANKAVEMRSNINLYMHGKAVLQAIPNELLFYTVLGIRQVENVRIYGGNIRGDRNEHMGTQGQWGMGISIINSYNITIEGTRVNECWADGFYIGTEIFYAASTSVKEKYSAPETIKLIDVKADRNRRQGISLISGRNIDFIRPVLSNTGGFGDPEAGLDIEPDNNTHVLENIYIEDAVTKYNAGAGIMLYVKNLGNSNTPMSIHINGHYDVGSYHGLLIQDKLGLVQGKVTIDNSKWEQSRFESLRINDHLVAAYKIEVNNAYFLNSARGTTHLSIIGPHSQVTDILGNIEINNPTFDDTTGRMSGTGIGKTGEVYQLAQYARTKDLKIFNPKYLGGFYNYKVYNYHELFIKK